MYNILFLSFSCRHFSSSFSIGLAVGVRIDYAFVSTRLFWPFARIFFSIPFQRLLFVFFFSSGIAWPMVLHWWFRHGAAGAYLTAIYFAIFSFIYCVSMAEREPRFSPSFFFLRRFYGVSMIFFFFLLPFRFMVNSFVLLEWFAQHFFPAVYNKHIMTK